MSANLAVPTIVETPPPDRRVQFLKQVGTVRRTGVATPWTRTRRVGTQLSLTVLFIIMFMHIIW